MHTLKFLVKNWILFIKLWFCFAVVNRYTVVGAAGSFLIDTSMQLHKHYLGHIASNQVKGDIDGGGG